MMNQSLCPPAISDKKSWVAVGFRFGSRKHACCSQSTTEDAEAVHIAWFNGTPERVSRQLQFADVLEAAATRLRTGQGWDESRKLWRWLCCRRKSESKLAGAQNQAIRNGRVEPTA